MRLRFGKRKKNKTLSREPDVLDGGMKTTESAIDRMIDEGLGGGNTDPHVNATLDPAVPREDEKVDTKKR